LLKVNSSCWPLILSLLSMVKGKATRLSILSLSPNAMCIASTRPLIFLWTVLYLSDLLRTSIGQSTSFIPYNLPLFRNSIPFTPHSFLIMFLPHSFPSISIQGTHQQMPWILCTGVPAYLSLSEDFLIQWIKPLPWCSKGSFQSNSWPYMTHDSYAPFLLFLFLSFLPPLVTVHLLWNSLYSYL